MIVKKKGALVDIPIKVGTIVRLRQGRDGVLTERKGIVLQRAPATDFTRAYGQEVFVCEFFRPTGGWKGGPVVSRRGVHDLYPVGRGKQRVPPACKPALEAYAKMYPSLGPKKRRR